MFSLSSFLKGFYSYLFFYQRFVRSKEKKVKVKIVNKKSEWVSEADLKPHKLKNTKEKEKGDGFKHMVQLKLCLLGLSSNQNVKTSIGINELPTVRKCLA